MPRKELPTTAGRKEAAHRLALAILAVPSAPTAPTDVPVHAKYKFK